MTENPYQTPTGNEVSGPLPPDMRAVRARHIQHEASVKAMGILCVLGGVMLLGSFAFVCIEVIAANYLPEPTATGLLFAFGLGTLKLISGIGLGQLQGWSRITASFVVVVSMFAVPIGTAFGIYLLYLLFSPRGGRVFTAGYREIVARTPDMHYRTPRWFWIAIAVMVVLLAALLIFFLVATPG
ncbi:hypothetical protein OKA04_02875 [Luteolibacter flavescens]|uniref:Uncharacterized protein n=1 Tax=Luteolibacter flavescens TaxID=1859460 RepID=A0ABT3FJD5_9BACT|nr:hypothetical protein [Luteolibacter flavescens]MCW1883655.1 hypothetical protein [Luteolibacter flavescens]